MKNKKTYLVLTVSAILILVVLLAPRYVEQQRNRVTQQVITPPGAEALAWHKSLFVADLHADTLLWDRDIGEQSSYGHVDLPRMRQAGEALQVFSMVTKTPHGLNLQRNAADSDDITKLAIVQRWPITSWFDLAERVKYMSGRLQRLEKNPANQFMLIRNQSDLQQFLQRRATQPGYLAGILSIEGAHPLQGSLARIDEFFALGVRFVGLTHFFDNELSGSAHGIEKQGLTEFGIQAIEKMQSLGMTIDLAHSSKAAFAQVIKLTRRPVIVSHTGVKGTCDKSRNLSDTQIRQVAATGGLIGIGFWPTAVCGTDVNSIVKAIKYAVKVGGIDSVALGSDFDGSVSTPFDVTGLPYLTDALLKNGFSKKQVSKIMGDNMRRFLSEQLPI